MPAPPPLTPPPPLPLPETKIVTGWRIACDGGGALGHPRVWLSIPTERGWVDCPYCDVRYVHQTFRGKVPL